MKLIRKIDGAWKYLIFSVLVSWFIQFLNLKYNSVILVIIGMIANIFILYFSLYYIILGIKKIINIIRKKLSKNK
jgi:hypothetical protein